MKKTFGLFLFGALSLFVFSCAKDDDSIIDENLKVYLGNYTVWNEHVNGLHPVWDSIGEIIDYEEHTIAILDSVLTISQWLDTDTLHVEGLLKGLYINGRYQAVKAIMNNDSLEIIYDQSSFFNKDFIKGRIWLTSDSLYLDYRWDSSDTYSAGAIPIFGSVMGRGVLLE